MADGGKTSLKRVEPAPVLPLWRRRDLAGLLETVMTIEAVSSTMPKPSAQCIENGLGLVKGRKDGAGSESSGRVAKGRKGVHVLSLPLLERIHRLAPTALPACSDLIWDLIGTGELPGRYRERPGDAFSGDVHNILHVDLPLFGVQCLANSGWCSVRPHHLRCLAAMGTLEAIAALWVLVLRAKEEGVGRELLVASYLPPALALFYRRPEGRRTAILLFARLRQGLLDGLKVKRRELSLGGYGLTKVAEQAPAWRLTSVALPNPAKLRRAAIKTTISAESAELARVVDELYAQRRRSTRNKEFQVGRPTPLAGVKHLSPTVEVMDPSAWDLETGLPRLPDDVVAWIEGHRAPTRPFRKRPPGAAKWSRPSLRLDHVINRALPSYKHWGKEAMATFAKELKGY